MASITRRAALGTLAAAPLVASCRATDPATTPQGDTKMTAHEDIVKSVEPLGFPWKTPDPFLFCVHHDDAYPKGNERLGPAVSLQGRAIGQDFSRKDGFSMYHGDVVPGFPQHPHRGFETVTVVRRGLVDHADSLGAAARYGHGDVQWLTAGKGIVHAEMFPLLAREEPNPLELFQIWLNLPSGDKFADPHFTMLWSHVIPKHTLRDEAGREVALTTIAGAYSAASGVKMPNPPPRSWASRAEADVAIWTIKLAPGAVFVVPAAKPGSNRMLYFFRGKGLTLNGRSIDARRSIEVMADKPARLENGADEGELLMLQGRPIGEPVAQQGPFVMNTPSEIRDAYRDYQRTRFGGWPWPSDGPVHGIDGDRFARHADGRIEKASAG